MRFFVVPIAFCISVMCGCATYRPEYPKQSAAAALPALPIDGQWESVSGVRIHIYCGSVVHECGLPADRGSVIVTDLREKAPASYEGTATVYSQQRKTMAKGKAIVTQPYRNSILISVTHSQSTPMICDAAGEYILLTADDPARLARAYEEGRR